MDELVPKRLALQHREDRGVAQERSMEPRVTDLITQLEQAIDGLLFPSESDAPLHIFIWREAVPFSRQALLETTGHDPMTPVQTTTLERFFRPVTTARSWYGADEQANLARFKALRALLQTKLRDIVVYKLGNVALDVYVVGHDAGGMYCGLTTKVVET